MGIVYRRSNIDKGESKTELLAEFTNPRKNIPEMTFGSNGKILKNEPNTNFLIDVCQTESTGSEATNQISSEHALRLLTVGLSWILELILTWILRLWRIVFRSTLCMNLVP